MADDKRGRDKQARDVEKRQRERAMGVALERADETEPPIEDPELDEIEAELDALSFPATGSDVVTAIGDRDVEADDGTYTVEELVADTETEVFDSPAAVRVLVQRPTVATAIKRIVEATDSLQGVDLDGSQREAYEKTFRALKGIDADDEDEGVEAIRDWVLEQIRDDGTLPGSRAVRRQAAEFCRANGYQVRNDEWLGI
ncbi:hypothetical protein NDI85_03925 [Halomicroarcula sp. S1AR25-4]|uniref:DUF5789 family protein n=1 Tax=Haloarcula sp. S1AR25-4 TaxID=2950538 RepID=UPI0028762C95|nr:hypothetical protein [Halomicroarcula sp. S1AR25-4]MDS0276926.1 hypothetical protein [Halomicroarcula sp. S1AR25-4]